MTETTEHTAPRSEPSLPLSSAIPRQYDENGIDLSLIRAVPAAPAGLRCAGLGA